MDRHPNVAPMRPSSWVGSAHLAHRHSQQASPPVNGRWRVASKRVARVRETTSAKMGSGAQLVKEAGYAHLQRQLSKLVCPRSRACSAGSVSGFDARTASRASPIAKSRAIDWLNKLSK